MKLTPPGVVISDQDPFANDLFHRDGFGDSLKRLIGATDENLVIFVNARWGQGKTTFCQMWRALLRNQNISTIYFDAFASDYFDNPFIAFSGEIISFLNKAYPSDRALRATKREFRKTAAIVGKKVLGAGLKLGVKAATFNVVGSEELSDFKDAVDEIASGIGKSAEDFVGKKIENHEKEKSSLKGFKENLAQIGETVRKKQGFPLTIIVDELDRCRPDYALNLLEQIKHLFDVPNVVFVLFVIGNLPKHP